MSNVQPKDKEMKWIDVQDQLPRDCEPVWVCALIPNPQGGCGLPYFQCMAQFYRSKGWNLAFNGKGDVHYWMPLPHSPDLPKWYIES